VGILRFKSFIRKVWNNWKKELRIKKFENKNLEDKKAVH